MTRVWVLLVAAAAAACAVGAAGADGASAPIRADTFSNLAANGNQEGLVLFYRSSADSHDEALETLDEVAGLLGDFRRSSFSIKTCDGDLPENKAEYDGAGFDTRVFWFTTTPASGIEKYEGPTDAASVAFHVRSKFAEFDPKDVAQFTTTEDLFDMMDEDVEGRPLFVKCYEQWCTHCKALAPTFQRAATFFRDQVQFVEVECSKDEDTKEFCSSNSVTGYPVLLLITGDRKVRYESGSRSVVAFDQFFRAEVDDYLSPVDEGQGAKPKKSSKKKKGKKKKGKKKKKKGKKGKKKKKAAAVAAAAAAAAEAESSEGGSARVAELETEVASLRETVASLEAGRREDQKALRSLTRKVEALVKSLADDDEEEEDDE